MNYKKELKCVKKALKTEKDKTIRKRLIISKVALKQLIKEEINISSE